MILFGKFIEPRLPDFLVTMQSSAALDVVAALVGELNPLDTEPQKHPATQGLKSATELERLSDIPETTAEPAKHSAPPGAGGNFPQQAVIESTLLM